MRTIMTIVSVWLMAGMSLAEGVRLGMTRAQVETELGPPASAMERGDRTILLYAGQGRVELIGGRVVEAAFVSIDDSTETPSATLPPPPPASPPTMPGPVAPTAENASPETLPPPDTAETNQADRDNVLSSQADGALPSSRFWGELALGTLVRLLITMVVLKVAFRWVDVYAEWGEMFIPALADSLTRGLIGASAYVLWNTEQLFYLDEGVAYFVLLFALLKTTHASTLQRAVAVTVAAKVASIVVWSFVSVFVSRWVLG